jgi:hypothetical protein
MTTTSAIDLSSVIGPWRSVPEIVAAHEATGGTFFALNRDGSRKHITLGYVSDGKWLFTRSAWGKDGTFGVAEVSTDASDITVRADGFATLEQARNFVHASEYTDLPRLSKRYAIPVITNRIAVP